MIYIIDTKASNLMSLVNAFKYLDIQVKVTNDIKDLFKSEYIIFLKDCYRSFKLDFPKIIDWPSWD